MEENKLKTATYPAWVLEHRTKGREIKHINGKYYVYGVIARLASLAARLEQGCYP